MYGIAITKTGGTSILVRLTGEFDVDALEGLRETLDGVAGLREPSILDLSGVTFLDILCTRELAVRSQLYAHQLSLQFPSWQVQATIRACGLVDWFRFEDVSVFQVERTFSETA